MNWKNVLKATPLAPFAWLSDIFTKNNSELTDISSSLLGKYTGSNLTEAERETNQFNAEEAEKQRNWEERMANTQYQRGVADMQAAGVNPALMFGSGQPAPTPAGSSASGTSPSSAGLADLIQLIMLPAQLANIKAQTRNIDEKTRTQEQITKLQTIAATYGVELTEAQISSILATATEKVAEADYKQSLKDLVVSQKVAQDIVNKYLDDRQRAEIDKIVAEKDKLFADEKLASAQAFFTSVQANYASANGFLMSSNDMLLIATYIADLFGIAKDDIKNILNKLSIPKKPSNKGGSR